MLANRAAANAANGLATPEWIGRLPFVGSYIADWWAANLAQPGAARDFLHHLNDGFVLVWARALGTELLHRLLLFFFTLLTSVLPVSRRGDASPGRSRHWPTACSAIAGGCSAII